MPAWFLKLIGIEGVVVEHADRSVLAFQYPQALWLGLSAAALVGVWIWMRQRRNLASASPALRAVLTGTRIVILVLLVLVLSGPYVKVDIVEEKRPIVALLIDRSQSMDLAAGPFPDADARLLAQAAGMRMTEGSLNLEVYRAINKQSRGKLVQAVVNAQRDKLIDQIAARFELQTYAVAGEPQRLDIDPARFALPDPTPPGGSSTHIGTAIAHVLNEAGGRPVAGIIVFSDGENNGGRSLTEAAKMCQSVSVPIFTIPAGSAELLRDIAIVDVSTSGQVAVGDSARVAMTIESQRYDGRTVKVQVRDGDKVLDTKEIALRSAEQQQVELIFTASHPGPRYLSVEIPPQPDEDLKGNNTDIAFLRVSDEKNKVLYVDCPPSWDFRFLKNAMRRDQGLAGRLGQQPEIVVENEWRRLPEAQRAQALPQTLEELAAYHTVVLGDASPKLLNAAFLKLLDEAVREKGVGVVVQAGPLAMPHGFDQLFLDLLPVQVDRREPGYFARPGKSYTIELAPDGMLHQAMRLHDATGRNQPAWAQMLPYQWCVAATRPSPAATVLAWNPVVQSNYGKLPLVAWHFAGQGRVLLVGTDSTWLWRQNVGDRYFYRFWGQSIRFVARRDDAHKRSWLEVSPHCAQPGEPAQIELMAFTAGGAPVQSPTQTITVSGPGIDKTETLHADANTKGRYTGKLTLPALGDYVFTYSPGGGQEPAEARLRVLAAPEEMRYPNVNRPALKTLAESSRKSPNDPNGGLMLELTDPDWAKKIVERLKGEIKTTMRSETRTIWDNWLVLALLVLVYSIDIGLRRLTGLS